VSIKKKPYLFFFLEPEMENCRQQNLDFKDIEFGHLRFLKFFIIDYSKDNWHSTKFPKNQSKQKRLATDKPGNKRRYDRTRNRSWKTELNSLLKRLDLFDRSHIPDRRVGGHRNFINSPKCW
jgi:hypothetical protein